MRWLALLLIVALLAANFWVSSQFLGPNPRVTIPYVPTFLAQVESGNVSSVNSTNASIQGTFKHAITYPTSGASAARPLMRAEVRVFWKRLDEANIGTCPLLDDPNLVAKKDTYHFVYVTTAVRPAPDNSQ